MRWHGRQRNPAVGHASTPPPSLLAVRVDRQSVVDQRDGAPGGRGGCRRLAVRSIVKPLLPHMAVKTNRAEANTRAKKVRFKGISSPYRESIDLAEIAGRAGHEN